MTTKKPKNKKNRLEKQVRDLSYEIAMLRSAVIGFVGEKDPEGEYRPEFLKKVLAAAKKKEKSVGFTDVDDFFAKIK